MCGLLGISTQDGIVIDRTIKHIFHEGITAMKGRGPIAWGILSSPPLTIAKGLGTMTETDLDAELASAESRDSNVFLVHQCAPTDGRTISIKDVHPFDEGDLYLAHNGILTAEDVNDLGGSSSDVDTQAMLKHIWRGVRDHKYPVPVATKITVENLRGSFACWLWSDIDGKLYLFRNYSPIYATDLGGAFVFSSVNIVNTDMFELRPGVVHQVVDGYLLPALPEHVFGFYTPYAEGAQRG